MTKLITYQFENKKAGQSWTKEKEKLVYVRCRTVHNLTINFKLLSLKLSKLRAQWIQVYLVIKQITLSICHWPFICLQTGFCCAAAGERKSNKATCCLERLSPITIRLHETLQDNLRQRCMLMLHYKIFKTLSLLFWPNKLYKKT